MKRITLFAFYLFLFGQTTLQAQNWVNGGNSLSTHGRIGTNTNYSLIFETYNTERGRLTNAGLWGIGTTAPNSKLHVNSTTSQDPLRVQVNNTTKLLVHRGGGVSIGLADVPPANGLLVNGSVGIGTVTPSSSYKLHVVSSATNSSGINIVAEGYGLAAEGGQIGIYAHGRNEGVRGYSPGGEGMYGRSDNRYGGYFLSINGTGLYATSYNGTYAALIAGNIYTYGSYQGSDKNIKKNIQEVNNAMSIINKLRPKNYEFKDDGKYASLHMPKGKHYGLLAQEVEEVLPNLVKETALELISGDPGAAFKPSADGTPVLPAVNKEPKETITIKAVNYTELIPIVIKGMQEQQQTIQQLQQENNALKDRLAKLEAALGSGKGYTGVLNGASIQQNYPNPFKASTTFNYSIPKGAKGQILVYDATGKLIRTLATSDSGQVQMDTNGLNVGTYVYSLMVDGNLIGSKQMVVIK